MKELRENFASIVNDIVTESILKMKDSIIAALKEKNIKLQKMWNLEARLFDLKKLQISRASVLGGMHGVTVDVKEGQLE